jgi:hypothetical protein
VRAVDQPLGLRLQRRGDVGIRAGQLPGRGRFDPLRCTNSTVMSLPPSCPQAAALITTAWAGTLPIVACAFRW